MSLRKYIPSRGGLAAIVIIFGMVLALQNAFLNGQVIATKQPCEALGWTSDDVLTLELECGEEKYKVEDPVLFKTFLSGTRTFTCDITGNGGISCS